MASISISTSRGLAGQKQTDYVTGTLATNAGDIELRINVLDGAGNAVTRKDVVLALDMFARQIEGGKTGAFGTTILAP
jgi:hypothetical protein